MKFLFLCKASTEIGLGHLIRTKSLALKLQELDNKLSMEIVVIGPNKLSKLLGDVPFDFRLIEDELEVKSLGEANVVFLDMTNLQNRSIRFLRNKYAVLVGLSPIFNQMGYLDILFNRTKYIELADEDHPNELHASLEYAFVQQNCKKISAGTYEKNLNAFNFPIALSMGGGDAANKTLDFLKSLKKCEVPATFWVMLGEGYEHSYDALIQEIKSDKQHEIILAKTNRSMWQILQNCILAILPGGITTYEATYAGLPSINLFEFESQQFLVKELVENDACLNLGLLGEKSFQQLNETIKYLYENRQKLLQMHIQSKSLMDENGAMRILKKVYNYYNTKKTPILN